MMKGHHGMFRMICGALSLPLPGTLLRKCRKGMEEGGSLQIIL